MSFVLDPERPVSWNVPQVASTELRLALDLARDPERSPADRIHSARTHCKKVRALIRLATGTLPTAQGENRAIREAAALLSGARDQEVMLATLGLLTQGSELTEHDAEELTRAVTANPVPPESGTIALEAFADAVAPIYVRSLQWRGSSDAGWNTIAKDAARTYRRARKRMRKASQSGEASDFHEWRKDVKYHWHHLTLLRRFDEKRFKPTRNELKQLAKALGEHHDVEVLTTELRRTMPHKDSILHQLAQEAGRYQQKRAEQALELGMRLFAARPREWHASVRELLAGGPLADTTPKD